MRRPRILLLATGGTIAMKAAEAGGGATPALDARAIAGEGPPVELVVRDLFAKGSASIGLADIAAIAAAIDEGAAEGIDGVVVTHGTDTLAETALALALTGRWPMPVVLTGAMRHAGLPGADGPANIAAALALAADPAARDMVEPLVVFGDEIHLASLVHKSHGTRLHAFSSSPLGPIGWMREGRAQILLRPARALPRLRLVSEAPAVAMLLVGADLEPDTVAALGGPEIGGVVLAAAGGGHVSARSVEALGALVRTKPVILASRAEGGVLTATYGYEGGEIDLIARGLIPAGRWRPEQARIILQLLLAAGAGRDEIAAALDK